MDAIWSYWSAPAGHAHQARWPTPFHHLISWVLSVGVARRSFTRTVLYTDSAGARLLADALALPFDEVHCALDVIPPSLERWWALGKLHAYRAHTRPFVHLDGDVYLWAPLPRELLAAPVFTQNPERFPFDDTYYAPAELVNTVRRGHGWVPEELDWYTRVRGNEACCCGILGTNRVDFIAEYADRGIALVQRNASLWESLPASVDPNVVIEQYLLSAFYYFHAHRQRYRGVEMAYLFATESDAYDERKTSAARFTHLIAEAKSDPAVLSRLVTRVETDFPDAFARAATVSERLTSALS